MGGLTRTRARIALTVLTTFFAGEASTTFLFRILILSSMSGALVLRARVAIITGLVGDVLVGRRGSNSAGAGGWTGVVRGLSKMSTLGADAKHICRESTIAQNQSAWGRALCATRGVPGYVIRSGKGNL